MSFLQEGHIRRAGHSIPTKKGTYGALPRVLANPAQFPSLSPRYINPQVEKTFAGVHPLHTINGRLFETHHRHLKAAEASIRSLINANLSRIRNLYVPGVDPEEFVDVSFQARAYSSITAFRRFYRGCRLLVFRVATLNRKLHEES